MGVTSFDIARLTGIPDRTIRHWQLQGIVPKSPEMIDALKAIIVHYQKSLESSSRKENKGALYEEEVRLTKARADKVELEVAEKEGILIKTDEVVKVWSDYILACRAKMLSIPAKLAYELAGEDNPLAVEGILREVIDQSLGELAEEAFVKGATTTNSDGDGVSPAAEVVAE